MMNRIVRLAANARSQNRVGGANLPILLKAAYGGTTMGLDKPCRMSEGV